MISKLRSLLQRNLIAYYGFTGHDNLGDEAIWQATRMLFSQKTLYPVGFTRFEIINDLIVKKKKQLLILGGGTLIGDNMKDGSNKFREQYTFLSRKASAKIVFGTGVGSLYGEINPPLWLAQWKSLLDNCDYIGVRGKQSQAALKVLGVDSEVIGDSACAWAYSKREPVRRKVLGVNVGAKRELLPDEKLKTYSKFIANRYSSGWEIEFYVLNPSDYQLTRDFAEVCGISNPHIITIYNDTEKYLEKISGAHCFIGTRLHSVILAMCAGVPSIMIGYAPKAIDFMESLNLQEFHLAISELTVDKLNDGFELLLTDTVSLSNQILSNMNLYKDIQVARAKEICSQL